MRGYLISFLATSGIVIFSVLLFFSSNLSFFCLFLELGTLCLVPLFFLYGSLSSLSSLFSYLVVSSISSSLIVCGILSGEVVIFLILGLLIKFGLFPFYGWIYKIITQSNWLVVWSFSTALKTPFFFFSFFLSSGYVDLVNYLSSLTFILCGILFWLVSFNWYYCWCHMMLVSSASLVAMAIVLGLDYLLSLFLIYIFWATLVVVFFYYSGSSMIMDRVGLCFLFCVLLVSFPGSFSVFYKLLMGSCIFSCGFFVFFAWVLYNISEQFYLVKLVIGQEIPKSLAGLFSLV
uniref:NADH dehydrogenase subunit 2 n=1 Tax=Notocotylus intestinalis TaxID=1197314 RepID=A0A8A4JFH7_9TREM|nr:NADH dehydrogenase subunit 2 [Notocotylus intestinalis]QTC30700.1 NADH dehydrogenase subunit 2 [Notocotylus intestinalis]